MPPWTCVHAITQCLGKFLLLFKNTENVCSVQNVKWASVWSVPSTFNFKPQCKFSFQRESVLTLVTNKTCCKSCNYKFDCVRHGGPVVKVFNCSPRGHRILSWPWHLHFGVRQVIEILVLTIRTLVVKIWLKWQVELFVTTYLWHTTAQKYILNICIHIRAIFQ